MKKSSFSTSKKSIAEAGLQLSPSEVSSFRDYLLSKKSDILNRSHEFQVRQKGDKDLQMDEADLAAKEISESMSLHLIERDRHLLYQIERALSRISNGVFGKCEGCEEAIGAKRLMASPFATLCISCTEEQEDRH